MNRLLRHLFYLPWKTRQAFPPEALRQIREAIQVSESKHSGEIRFIIEGALSPSELRKTPTARDRALELFAEYRVWDTEENNGVLVYVLMCERKLEIIADREISKKVGTDRWTQICQSMQTHFQSNAYLAGTLEGIAQISTELESLFPPHTPKNELSDDIILLR